MRIAVLLLALAGCSPALAQGLDGSLNGVLFGNLNGGIQSGFLGNLDGSLGQRTRPAILPSDRLNDDGERDYFRRQELARQGFDLGRCAPTQLDRNATGCRPIREFLAPPTSYDLSIQGLGPLGGLTLPGQTLALPPGPASPLD